jgi:hypothetical protein
MQPLALHRASRREKPGRLTRQGSPRPPRRRLRSEAALFGLRFDPAVTGASMLVMTAQEDGARFPACAHAGAAWLTKLRNFLPRETL